MGFSCANLDIRCTISTGYGEMREIIELQSALAIDPAVLLLMAREAAGDFRLRFVGELTEAGRLALIADLHEMALPLAA